MTQKNLPNEDEKALRRGIVSIAGLEGAQMTSAQEEAAESFYDAKKRPWIIRQLSLVGMIGLLFSAYKLITLQIGEFLFDFAFSFVLLIVSYRLNIRTATKKIRQATSHNNNAL